MLFGIGCDITKVIRFEKWVKNPDIISRFFREEELAPSSWGKLRKCEHYAARFAAKEAFSKALGTGIAFSLKDIWVVHNDLGCPLLKVSGKAKELLEEKCGKNVRILLTMSHEKEYAIAYIAIERG